MWSQTHPRVRVEGSESKRKLRFQWSLNTIPLHLENASSTVSKAWVLWVGHLDIMFSTPYCGEGKVKYIGHSKSQQRHTILEGVESRPSVACKAWTSTRRQREGRAVRLTPFRMLLRWQNFRSILSSWAFQAPFSIVIFECTLVLKVLQISRNLAIQFRACNPVLLNWDASFQ